MDLTPLVKGVLPQPAVPPELGLLGDGLDVPPALVVVVMAAVVVVVGLPEPPQLPGRH